MKLLESLVFLMTSVTLMTSVLPANADTNLPDFSKNRNPLEICETTKLGTETSTTQISSGQSENPLYASSTSKDQIGRSCDGIAESIARVETNRADNETLYKIHEKKMQVEFMKMLFAW